MKKKTESQKNYSVKKEKKKKPLSIVITDNYKQRKTIEGKPTFIDEHAGYIYQVLPVEQKQLPTECPTCGAVMSPYIFDGEVADEIVEIKGIKCDSCSVCFFQSNTFVKNFDAFKKLKRIKAENIGKRRVKPVTKSEVNVEEPTQAESHPEPSKQQKSSKKITRYIENGKIRATVLPRDRELPNKCDRCGEKTKDLIYVVKENTGETKNLLGKECPLCGTIYYSQWLYSQNKLFFAGGNATSEETLVRKLINQYLKSTNKNFTKDARKSLISTNEDIDWILREYLEKSDSDAKRKILYVAIRRNPSEFLLDLWEEYRADLNEFDKIISQFDFSEEKLHNKAIELIGVISPYPTALLNKISKDKAGQRKIFAEMKNGEFSVQYLKYIATENHFLLEDWVQDEILGRVQTDDESFMEFIPYLDLNRDNARHFVNTIDDLAILDHVYNTNICGIDAGKYKLSKLMECIIDFNNSDLTDADTEVMDEFFRRVMENKWKVETKVETIPKYFDMLISLADAYSGLPLVEALYKEFCDTVISLKNCESILASYKSEMLFERWISTLNNLEMTPKHAQAKQLLMSYPEQSGLIFAEVEHSEDPVFIKNVKIMAEGLNIPWDAMDEEEYNYARGIREKENVTEAVLEVTEDNDVKNEVVAPVEESSTIESVDPEELYTDDFGNTFDLSELKHILDL